MGFPQGLILKPTAVNKAGVFGGSVHGIIPLNAALEVPRWEAFIEGDYTQTGIQQGIFGINYDRNQEGWGILHNELALGVVLLSANNGVTVMITNTNLNGDFSINIKAFGGGSESTWDVDASSGLWTNRPWTFNNGANIVGANRSTNPYQFLNGNIRTLQYFQLDNSGNRIAELINLDWSNGDANTVQNIGADAPANTDMTWGPAGSGTYVDV